MSKIFYYFRKTFFLGVAYFFFLLNSLFPRKDKSIVIFHALKLGDLVCATGVFREVKQAFPDHRLIVIARENFNKILKNNSHIDTLIGFTSQQQTKQYKWIIRTALKLRMKYRPSYFLNLSTDFEVNVFGLILGAPIRLGVSTEQDGKLQKLIYPLYRKFPYAYQMQMKEHFFTMLESIGVRVKNKKNELFFPGTVPEVESLLSAKKWEGNSLIVGVSLTSGKSFKSWPGEYWSELLNTLVASHQAKFLFFGSAKEAEYIQTVVSQIRGDFEVLINKDLDIMPYYLKKCRLFIGVDTGPLYMADVMRVPVVDILGPCDAKTQRPDNDYVLVTNSDHCRPLSKILLTPGVEHYEEMRECFRSISVEHVYHACIEAIAKLRK